MKFDRKKHSAELRQRVGESRISSALEYIRRKKGYAGEQHEPYDIRPFIHRIILSGSRRCCEGSYQILFDAFGGFIKDPTFEPEKRMPKYEDKWIRTTKEFQINAFIDPLKYYFPFFLLEINTHDASPEDLKSFLHSTDLKLPGLLISSADYTLDIFCNDSLAAQCLFAEFMRHLHIPYQRGGKLTGDDLMTWGSNTMNAAFRIGQAQFYERGPDRKKEGDAWHIKDVDRVRLEYTAWRRIFQKKGISTLRDFIKRPKFYDINKGLYNFRHFIHSRKLPKFFEDYKHADPNTSLESLHLELKHHRGTTKNINQYLHIMRAFNPLREDLLTAMKDFDRDWRGYSIKE